MSENSSFASSDPVTDLVLEVFFDFACPWSFVAFNRAREAAMRTQAQIEWRPLSHKAFYQHLNIARSVSEMEAAHDEQSWIDWLDYCGLKTPHSYGAGSELDSSAALAACLYAAEFGKATLFTAAVFDAVWSQGQDITDVSLLKVLTEGSGIDVAGFDEWLEQSVVSDALARNIAELIERKGFSTPTFFVEDRMFSGNGNLPLVELALGQASDISFVMPGSHYWDGDPEADPVTD